MLYHIKSFFNMFDPHRVGYYKQNYYYQRKGQVLQKKTTNISKLYTQKDIDNVLDIITQKTKLVPMSNVYANPINVFVGFTAEPTVNFQINLDTIINEFTQDNDLTIKWPAFILAGIYIVPKGNYIIRQGRMSWEMDNNETIITYIATLLARTSIAMIPTAENPTITKTESYTENLFTTVWSNYPDGLVNPLQNVSIQCGEGAIIYIYGHLIDAGSAQ